MTPLGARRLGLHRRDLLAATVSVLAFLSSAQAATLKGIPDWSPNGGSPPQPVRPGPWQFFSPEEGAVVEALVDRLIPPDPNTPGGKEAGCAVFIDRQLAGPYGDRQGQYLHGPFIKGTPEQGAQSAQNPSGLYRTGLAALDRHCRSLSDHGQRTGRPFAELDAGQQDEILRGMEAGSVTLESIDAKTFFQQIVQDVQQGFFADPIYGGNKDMCAWKMIGFPGAHYDYRAWVGRHSERYPYPPVSIAGRPEWTPREE